MSTEDIYKNEASNFLNIAMQNNDLSKFLGGRPPYDMMFNGGDFSARRVMTAIYDRYQNDKNPGFLIDVYNAMLENFQEKSLNGRAILNSVDCIRFQLLCEKQNIAPFKLDCKELLKKVSNNLKAHEDYYKRSNGGNSNTFWDEFLEMDNKLSDNYNHKIL